jgi:diadenosine tetraphosphate (Ap4A) HIT family hydrolase
MGRRHPRELLSSPGAVDKRRLSNIRSRLLAGRVGVDGLDGRMTGISWANTGLAGDSATRVTPLPTCSTCGFALWIPIAALSVSQVGLYDDARFPGRLIVSLNEHVEHYDQANPEVLSAFMSDLQRASLVLRKMANVDRVNIAMLGNKDPHLHAHMIPRRVTDDNYGVSPWENATEHSKLAPTDKMIIIDLLKHGFAEVAGSAPDCLC